VLSETASAVTPTVAIRHETLLRSAPVGDVGADDLPTHPGSYLLALEMGKDRFRFGVTETSVATGRKPVTDAQPRCIWLEEYTFSSLLAEDTLLPSLETIYRSHPVLQRPADFWGQVRVSVNTPSFTLVPSHLFRKEYAASYLQLMRGSALPFTEHAYAFAHPAEGFHCVFSVDTRLTDWLAATYPLQQVALVHQTSALIQASALLCRRSAGPNLLLYFEDEYVTIVARQGTGLRLCNKFAYKNAADLAYYVLYVLSELRWEPASVGTLLYGEITPFADSYASLARFLPQLSFGSTLPELALTPDFDELPEHRYLSLYGLNLL